MTKTVNIVERGRARKQGVPWRHKEAIDLSSISHPVDQANEQGTCFLFTASPVTKE